MTIRMTFDEFVAASVKALRVAGYPVSSKADAKATFRKLYGTEPEANATELPDFVEIEVQMGDGQ